MALSKRDCKTKCGANVEAVLESKPKVSCQEVSKCGTQFDTVIDFNIKPRCKANIVEIKRHTDKCGARALFTVDIDFECSPLVTVNNCMNKPRAEFDIKFEVDHDIDLKNKKVSRRSKRTHTLPSSDSSCGKCSKSSSAKVESSY